jgi:hypothetical protein
VSSGTPTLTDGVTSSSFEDDIILSSPLSPVAGEAAALLGELIPSLYDGPLPDLNSIDLTSEADIWQYVNWEMAEKQCSVPQDVQRPDGTARTGGSTNE